VRKVGKILVYYHDDLDGKCSAAIVNKAMKDKWGLKFIPWVHDGSIQNLPYDIDEYWRVYILDITLPEDMMENLRQYFERSNIIWIDHHIGAIRELGDKFSDFEGTRSTDKAACVLTWEWFYGKTILPKTVDYIGQRDIWDVKTEDAMYLVEALSMMDLEPENDVWDYYLDKLDLNIYGEISKGRELRNARLKAVYDSADSLGYESEIDGHRCLKVNYSYYDSISDMGRYIVDDLKYPVAWMYYVKKNNNGKFVIVNNLRSSDVDVSAIATKRGGGGHLRASGWTDYLEKESEFTSRIF
jgi:oligoribonuclease NrnB/cAMP/cGMP phosphodiesterase (DHH superfamily)